MLITFCLRSSHLSVANIHLVAQQSISHNEQGCTPALVNCRKQALALKTLPQGVYERYGDVTTLSGLAARDV